MNSPLPPTNTTNSPQSAEYFEALAVDSANQRLNMVAAFHAFRAAASLARENAELRDKVKWSYIANLERSAADEKTRAETAERELSAANEKVRVLREALVLIDKAFAATAQRVEQSEARRPESKEET